MSPDFLRQRRNLIGISVIIILFKVAEISTDKILLLGTSFDIGKPEIIPYFIWAIWFYFLLRYYQYIKSEKEFGFSDNFKKWVNHKAGKHTQMTEAKDSYGAAYTDFRIRNKGWLKWEYANHGYDTEDGRYKERTQMDVSILLVYWWSVQAFFHVMINTNQFTEYLLPFSLAFAAPIIAIFI